MAKTHKYKTTAVKNLKTMVLSNPDVMKNQDRAGGPQQMSIRVRRWKKWLSSNVWDVLDVATIAMPSHKHRTCHEIIPTEQIVKVRFESFANKGATPRNFSENNFLPVTKTDSAWRELHSVVTRGPALTNQNELVRANHGTKSANEK